MLNDPVRVIIDTNLWISFLIKRNYSNIDSLLFFQKINLVFSTELLHEFTSVAKRPKFEKYFSTANLQKTLDLIKVYADFIEVKTVINACRDEKDNFLLSLAIDGNVSYLITGDLDLLELKRFEQTKILSITDFLNSEII